MFYKWTTGEQNRVDIIRIKAAATQHHHHAFLPPRTSQSCTEGYLTKTALVSDGSPVSHQLPVSPAWRPEYTVAGRTVRAGLGGKASRALLARGLSSSPASSFSSSYLCSDLFSLLHQGSEPTLAASSPRFARLLHPAPSLAPTGTQSLIFPFLLPPPPAAAL